MKNEYVRKGIFYIVSGVFLSICFMRKMNYVNQRNVVMQEDIAEKVLRFHVVANSDSGADQTLKLEVRDAVGSYMAPFMKSVKDKAECEKVVKEHLSDIEDTAEAVVQKEGYDYPVTAGIASVNFPVKTYDCYTFPAGTYEALNVKIGDAAGKNWWCVMYPNMCFAGDVYEVADEDAKESLQHVLTKEEYASLMENKNYEIKFKYIPALDKLFE